MMRGLDVEADEAVVQQQHRAGSNVLRQFLVVESDAVGIAQLDRRVEDERLSGLEPDLALGEFADADLRPLQVRHDRDLAAEPMRALAHQLRALHVVGRAAVREIEADDIRARGQHSLHHIRVAARGA